MIYRLILLVFCLGIFSCSPDPVEPKDITCTYNNQMLNGSVLNRLWQFREGYATLSGSEYQLFFHSANEIDFSDICNIPVDSLADIQITLNIDNEVGEYYTGGSRTVTIYDNSDETIASHTTGGCVRIDEITSSSISGAIDFDSSGDIFNGSFELKICN